MINLLFCLDRNYTLSIIHGSVMAPLKFFKLDPAKKGLTHPSGPLSTVTSTLSIAEVNEEVEMIRRKENKKERHLSRKFLST